MITPLGYKGIGPLGRAVSGAAARWYLGSDIPLANCIAAYQPIGAASLAASYVNLAHPGTNDAAPGSAPSWNTSNGWTFNGTANYLTTGISPATDWSVLVRFSDSVANDTWIFGLYTSTGWGVQAGYGSTRYYYNVGVLPQSGVQTTAIMGFANKTAYLNGVSEGTISGGTITTTDLYIGDVHYSGGHRYYSGKIQAFAIYDIELSGAQMAAVTTNMQALA